MKDNIIEQEKVDLIEFSTIAGKQTAYGVIMDMIDHDRVYGVEGPLTISNLRGWLEQRLEQLNEQYVELQKEY